MIILEKAKKEEILSKNIANTITVVEVAQISSFVDLAERYN